MQLLAESQTRTYTECPYDIRAMAAIGAHGHSGQNCRKQLEQLFPKQLICPQPFVAKLPVLKKIPGEGEWTSCFEEISFFWSMTGSH